MQPSFLHKCMDNASSLGLHTLTAVLAEVYRARVRPALKLRACPLQETSLMVAIRSSPGRQFCKCQASPAEALHIALTGALLRTGPDQVKIVPRAAAPGRRRRLRATEGSTILDVQLQPSPGAVRDQIPPISSS